MKKVLLVDDNKDFTVMVKRCLELSGEYDVRTENLGANALSVAREFRPDIILLDIVMGDMEGTEVGGQIKADKDLKNTPVIFLTGAVTKEELGSTDGIISGRQFIAKPVSADELVDCIEKRLSQ